MSVLPFAKPSDLRAVTWTLSAGTPVGATYGASALFDGNPEANLWIAETGIDIRGDQGSALRVDGLAIIHHNFQAATTLRLQMHSDTATWAGATIVDMTVDVGTWQGRWAPHVYFDVSAVSSLGDRTQRYLRLTNVDANNAAIKIGELVTVGVVSELSRGIRATPSPRTPLTYGRSLNTSVAGVQTVHDYRTRIRSWVGVVALGTVDEPVFRAWQDDSYGVRPFIVWPIDCVSDEPVYGRFASATYEPILVIQALTDASFVIEELSCGEAY